MRRNGNKSKAQKTVNAPKSSKSPGGATVHVADKHSMASQTETSDPALLEQSNFEALMRAITGCQSSLSDLTIKIDTVQLEVGRIRQDFDKIRQRVTERERRVRETEDTVRDHTASLHTLQVRVRSLEARSQDVENRNRRTICGLSVFRKDRRGLTQQHTWSGCFAQFFLNQPSRPSS